MPETTEAQLLEPAVAPASARTVGAARVLALGYGFFTLAAGARSGVQLATTFSHAPVAYLLSALAAAIYLLGMIAMIVAERVPARRPLARRLCLIELFGVLAVGTASVAVPSAFPDATVWSGFGIGYAFVPVALPLLALLWTRQGGATRSGDLRRRTPLADRQRG